MRYWKGMTAVNKLTVVNPDTQSQSFFWELLHPMRITSAISTFTVTLSLSTKTSGREEDYSFIHLLKIFLGHISWNIYL